MKINERKILKLSVRDGYVIFQTYSRQHGRSSQFYMASEVLDTLETTGTAIAMDDPYFVKLGTYHDIDGTERLRLCFTWLSPSGNDAVRGRKDCMELDYAQFRNAVQKSREMKGTWQELLSLRAERGPTIRMASNSNLAQVLKHRTLRKKFGRFLASNFRWKGVKSIHITADFLPYSFTFWEELSDGRRGVCGGIILHGREDLRTAHYEIHT